MASDLPGLIAQLRTLCEDANFTAAQAFKRETGRPLLGHFPVYSPAELFYAAGAHPVAIVGAGTQIEIHEANSRFQSFICSIVKSTLELGLSGRLKGFDGVVFHSICDAARNLSSVFQRNLPDLWVEYLHFPQNLVSDASVDYLDSEYRRLLSRLHELTGKTVTNDDVNAAIALYNRQRALVRQLYAFRRAHPDILTSHELYTIVRAGDILPVTEHIDLLTRVFTLLPQKAPRVRDALSVVLVGAFCEQPPLDLVVSLEEAGLHILDDDWLLRHRWYAVDVPENQDGVRALAQAYRDHSPSTAVQHDPRRDKSAELIARVQTVGADAVIIASAKFCEPALFDYATYHRALSSAGIPHLFMEFEENMWLFDKIQTEIETFVESLLLD